MFLNELAPAWGSKKEARRVGRGPGTGVGKTCGLGHKGQKARAGGYHRVGFEGGQTPLQRRLPKVGFTSLTALKHYEIRLNELNKLAGDVVSLHTLKDANLLPKNARSAKIMLRGEITRSFVVKIACTKGAKAAIEAAGGRVEVEASAAS